MRNSFKPAQAIRPTGLPMGRREFTAAVVVGCATLWLTSLMAFTLREQKFTCPIDQNVFLEVVASTGTSYGCRLDNKPLGPIAAPWTLAQCPQCKFVIAWATNDEAMVTKLRPFVLSREYQSVASNGPTYLCLARLREVLGASPLETADAYLKASWQLEKKEPDRCRELLQSALTNYATASKVLPADDRQRPNVERLCGELERRLGRFDDARARLEKLRETTLDTDDRATIERQLGFIQQRDSAPHAATEALERLVTGNR